MTLEYVPREQFLPFHNRSQRWAGPERLSYQNEVIENG